MPEDGHLCFPSADANLFAPVTQSPQRREPWGRCSADSAGNYRSTQGIGTSFGGSAAIARLQHLAYCDGASSRAPRASGPRRTGAEKSAHMFPTITPAMTVPTPVARKSAPAHAFLPAGGMGGTAPGETATQGAIRAFVPSLEAENQSVATIRA